MSQGKRDLEAFYREVEYGCAVVKLTAGLLAATGSVLVLLASEPGAGAGVVLAHLVALIELIDRSLGIVL